MSTLEELGQVGGAYKKAKTRFCKRIDELHG
jgi:hypothetical protein